MKTLPRSEYVARRERLLAEVDENSLVLVPAAREQIRNRDVEFPFRQDSDFYYLSGFGEPDALLVLAPGRAQGQYLLFCRPRDPQKEIWNGYRAGPEGAVSDYGADQAFSLDELDQQLPDLLAGRQRVYYSIGHQADLEQRLRQWLSVVRGRGREGVSAPTEFVHLDPLLHEHRLIKSPTEIELMSQGARISAQAHRQAMMACAPGVMEYQLQAIIEYRLGSEGCRWPAYSTIVGGGRNGCILHYIDNRDPLRDGDLVLIDAGGELDYYAADITRTFPVSGRFSPEQRALYELVLRAQEAAIAAIGPGRAFSEFHERALTVLVNGLVELGLLKGAVEALIEEEAYKPFYMHKTGHWLGMDVHDVGDYRVDGQWRALQPGMVVTVEPGLYIGADNTEVEPRWRGIGIRIEDNVVVTEEGAEVITADVPKTVAELEALVGSKVESQ